MWQRQENYINKLKLKLCGFYHNMVLGAHGTILKYGNEDEMKESARI